MHAPDAKVQTAADSERFATPSPSLTGCALWPTPARRDCSNLINSESWRRLGDKPQAMAGLYSSSHRNRLTHSLEVASIARNFGSALGCDPDVLEFAGAAHDLGHPPFGHSGEALLADYMRPYGGFEGNAQTFRILTRLAQHTSSDGRSVGFNATRASLDATVKYPWSHRDVTPAKPGKFGYYDDDATVFDWVRDGAPQGKRSLEAQAMDWADDIAYALSDFEDGMRFGYPDGRGGEYLLIDMAAILGSTTTQHDLAQVAAREHCAVAPERIAEVFAEYVAGNDDVFGPLKTIEDPDTAKTSEAKLAMAAFSERLRMKLQVDVIAAMHERFGTGPLQRYDADLIVPPESAALCGFFQAINSEFVLRSDPVLDVRKQEDELLRELISLYGHRPELLPTADEQLWSDAVDEAGRHRVIADRIARMTNSSAVVEHRRLRAGSRTSSIRPRSVIAVGGDLLDEMRPGGNLTG